MSDESAHLELKVSSDEAKQAAITLDKLTQAAVAVEKAVGTMAKAITDSEKRTQDANKRIGEYVAQTEKAEAANKKLAEAKKQAAADEPKALQQARLGLAEYRSELEKVVAEREKLERVRSRTGDQTRELDREKAALERLRKEMGLVEKATVQTDKAVKGLDTRLGGLATQIAATVGAGLVIRDATKSWLEYDEAIKQVNTIANFDDGEFKKIRRDVLDLSKAMGVDAKQAAEGLFATIQDGIKNADSFDFLETAIQTSIGGRTSIDTAVNSITNVINAYKLEASDAQMISDKLFATVLDGKATFEELGGQMANTTVPAAALGVEFDEVLAMVIAITKQGTSASEAFTQITSAITAVLNPSEEMLAIFQDLNVQTGEQAVAQVGLVGILEKAREKYEGNSAALVKAVGRVEALKAILATTGENAQLVASGFDSIEKSSGNTARAAEKNSDNVANAIRGIKTALVELVEQMENSFAVFSTFAQYMREITGAMGVLSGTAISDITSSALAVADKAGGISGIEGLETRIDQLKRYKVAVEAVQAKGGMAGRFVGYEGGSGVDQVAPKDFGTGASRALGFAETSTILREINDELERMEQSKSRLLEKDGESIALIRKVREIEADANLTLEEKTRLIDGLKDKRKAEADAVAVMGLAEDEMHKRNLATQAEKVKLAEQALEQEKEGNKLAADATEKSEKAYADAMEARQKAEDDLTDKKKKAASDELDHIRKIGTNKREELQKEIEIIRARKAKNDLSKEDVALADKAIAALEKQLFLLDENGEAIKRAKVVDESKLDKQRRRDLESMFDMGPIFEKPTNNLFEQLDREEEEVRRSYEQRKRDILELTEATETEKAALMNAANEQMIEAQRHFSEERNKAYLGYAADFFGNLSTMAGAFGKKGYKAAQAAAIAETVVNTYASATAAYKSLASIPYVGPVLGAAAAGAAVAAGFANIQKIRSTEYSGAYEHGGLIPTGKYGLVGETGEPELVRGPAVVTSVAATRDKLRGSSGSEAPQLNVVVNNLPGQDAVVTQRKDGTTQIEIIEQVMGDLAKQARDGNGNIFPAFARRHALTPKGS